MLQGLALHRDVLTSAEQTHVLEYVNRCPGDGSKGRGEGGGGGVDTGRERVMQSGAGEARETRSSAAASDYVAA